MSWPGVVLACDLQIILQAKNDEWYIVLKTKEAKNKLLRAYGLSNLKNYFK